MPAIVLANYIGMEFEKGLTGATADTEKQANLLIGDATKAKDKLGWVPKHSLSDLVKDMMESDLELFKKQQTLHDSGFKFIPQSEEK